jgi:hypothetical protein
MTGRRRNKAENEAAALERVRVEQVVSVGNLHLQIQAMLSDAGLNDLRTEGRFYSAEVSVDGARVAILTETGKVINTFEPTEPNPLGRARAVVETLAGVPAGSTGPSLPGVHALVGMLVRWVQDESRESLHLNDSTDAGVFWELIERARVDLGIPEDGGEARQ